MCGRGPLHRAIRRPRLNARDGGPVSSTPNPASSVHALSCLGDSTGKLLLASKSRDGSTAIGSESCTHPVDRNTAVSDDGDRGLLHPAISLNSVVNAIESDKPALTRPMCDKLIAKVHLDRNCSSSSKSNCIRSNLVEADLHNPGCSRVHNR